jgi:hypothetical protein
MTLRKTRRHSKTRRAHSKKTRRTYKIRGGFKKEPVEGDRIMYFRFFNDDEGYAGTINTVKKNGDVMVDWDGYSNPIFEKVRWAHYVENHYGSLDNVELVSQASAKKREGTKEIFPQIAYLGPEGKSKSFMSRLLSRSKKTGSKSKKTGSK